MEMNEKEKLNLIFEIIYSVYSDIEIQL